MRTGQREVRGRTPSSRQLSEGGSSTETAPMTRLFSFLLSCLTTVAASVSIDQAGRFMDVTEA